MVAARDNIINGHKKVDVMRPETAKGETCITGVRVGMTREAWPVVLNGGSRVLPPIVAGTILPR